jgi:hypothetical protein
LNEVNQQQKLNSSGGFQRVFLSRNRTLYAMHRGPWPMLTSMAASVFLRGNENQTFSFAGIYQSLHPRSYDIRFVSSFHGKKRFSRLDGSQRSLAVKCKQSNGSSTNAFATIKSFQWEYLEPHLFFLLLLSSTTSKSGDALMSTG